MTESRDEQERVESILSEYPETRLDAAKAGDPSELIASIEGGSELSKLERNYIAAIIRDTSKAEAEQRYQLEVALLQHEAIWIRADRKKEAFIHWAMERYGVSRAKVFRILRSARKNADACAWRDFWKGASDLDVRRAHESQIKKKI